MGTRRKYLVAYLLVMDALYISVVISGFRMSDKLDKAPALWLLGMVTLFIIVVNILLVTLLRDDRRNYPSS